jgi:hypothetical protein
VHVKKRGTAKIKMVTSLGRLLGKPQREKPVIEWIIETRVSLVSREVRDNEAKMVDRNDGWRREQ